MSTANVAANPLPSGPGHAPAPSVSPNPLPLLPYADLPSRWGVAVETVGDGGMRVAGPTLPIWRHLSAGYFIVAALLAFIVLLGAWIAVRERSWAPFLGNTAVYGGALAVLLAAAVRLRRRLLVEVTPQSVSVSRPLGQWAGRRRAWPRAISEIKLNRINGSLLIRVTGVELVELYLGPNRALNDYVAGVLSEAVRRTSASVTTAAALEHPASVAADQTPSRFARRVLLSVAAIMALGAGVLFCLPFPGPQIAIYVLIFACALVGIALVTREKEFYV